MILPAEFNNAFCLGFEPRMAPIPSPHRQYHHVKSQSPYHQNHHQPGQSLASGRLQSHQTPTIPARKSTLCHHNPVTGSKKGTKGAPAIKSVTTLRQITSAWDKKRGSHLTCVAANTFDGNCTRVPPHWSGGCLTTRLQKRLPCF